MKNEKEKEKKVMSPQRRMTMFKAFTDCFRYWLWVWYATLTFSGEFRRVNFEKATSLVRIWLRRIAIEEGIQVGGFFSLCLEKGRTHVHMLLLGQGISGGSPKNLTDVDPQKWARRWFYFARVEVISSQRAAAKYVAAQFLKHEEVEIDFYNRHLLERTRIEPDLGPCLGADIVEGSEMV